MSDTCDDWRALRELRKEDRRRNGIDCPGCHKVQPKRTPTRLLPGQRCRVCGHRDVRKPGHCPDCGQCLADPQRPVGHLGRRPVWCATCERPGRERDEYPPTEGEVK